MLWLYQRHALKAVRASVGDKEGHKRDCILTGLACAKQIEKKKALNAPIPMEEITGAS